MYEIYLNTGNDTQMVENLTSHVTLALREMEFSFLNRADQTIKENYPDCYTELEDLHGSGKAYLHSRVRQFFACNFSEKDGHIDIDDDWNFILENVPCPARLTGICTMQICNPKIKKTLSERETEVLRLFAKGFDEKEIAEALFISKNTAHNHIQNIYRKTGLAGKTSPATKLVAYAHAKGII
ncbi:MAG: helix-turn-helix domain-containing protein [Prolixibacteraceae bacterium]